MARLMALLPHDSARIVRDIIIEAEFDEWFNGLPTWSHHVAEFYLAERKHNWTVAQREKWASEYQMSMDEYEKHVNTVCNTVFTVVYTDEYGVEQEARCPSYEERDIRKRVDRYLAAVERLNAAEAKKKKAA